MNSTAISPAPLPLRVFVAGHRGMVGRALTRAIEKFRPHWQVLTASRENLDLCEQAAVFSWLTAQKPDVVIIAAAKVGGIHANATYPAEFLYENLAIAANLVEGSRRADVGRLLFLGSSCIYPRLAPQPMVEECLLEGPLEATNEAYALAKIAGLKLCQQ
jgi:GDP-L-fucose synthase